MVNFSTVLQHLSDPRLHVPLATTIIPVYVWGAYRWARFNMYRQIPTIENFNQNSNWMIQRNAQHRLFVIVAVAETMTFFALSKINPYFLIPACYTLGHLIWTDWSKRNETTQINGTYATPSIFWSMDGKKPLVN